MTKVQRATILDTSWFQFTFSGVNVTILVPPRFTKVKGATAKRVLWENFAETSWSRLVASRVGYCSVLDAAPAASTMMITCRACMSMTKMRRGEGYSVKFEWSMLCRKMSEQDTFIRRTFFKKVNLVFWFVKVRLRDGYSWDNQSETTWLWWFVIMKMIAMMDDGDHQKDKDKHGDDLSPH